MLFRRGMIRLRAAPIAALLAATALAPVVFPTVPAFAQTADREARLGWVRERYMAERARLETLRASRTPEAYLELGEVLVDGELTSPENPLRKPDFDGARQAFDEGLKVPSKVWPLAASRLAELLFAGRRGELATPGEVARGIDLLARSASLGYGEGAFKYGFALEAGLDGPDKLTQAEEAYRLGTRLQYPEAAFALARLLGFDSPEGKALVAQGLVLFDLFAPRSRGLLVALGDIRRDGIGVPVDPYLALEAYRRAFSMGSGQGGHRIADMLLSGALGAPDPIEARRVLEETAWSGSSYAAVRLADDFATDGPMRVGAEDAIAWLDLAMAVEDYRAFAVASQLYFAGKGVPRDVAKGEEYARRAAEDAQASISDIMSIARSARAALGDAAPRGLLLGIYNRAAQAGSVEGMAELGILLVEGADQTGGPGDGLLWLQKAAAEGSVKAELMLGDLHRAGRIIEPSPEAALAWYRKAIASGKSLGAYVRAAELMIANPALAQSPDEPLALLRTAAEKGSTSAERTLGRLYLNGTLVQRDPLEARRWLEQAVSHGDATSLVILADLYSGRFGDAPDPAATERLLEQALASSTPKAAPALAAHLIKAGRVADAVAVLERAGDAGNSEALIELGVMFLGGNMVPRDLARAEGYFDRASALTGSTPKAETDLAIAFLSSGEPLAAARGVVRLEELAGEGVGRAAATLSNAYRTGNGVTVDLAAAERWAIEAAKLGVIDSLIAVADANFATGRSRESHEKAVRFYETALAAEPGSVRALTALARAYKLGRGTPQDLPRALDYFQRAADAGSGSALIELSEAYQVGSGVEPDPKKAVAYLERAVERGIVGAYVDLGRFYLSGFGGRIDPERAVVNFARAAQAGNLGGLMEYGRSLNSGYGTTKNVDAGIVLLTRAADADVVDAMMELYAVYSTGFDKPVDMAKAVYWLERAAATDDDALTQLNDLVTAGTIALEPSRAAYWRREAEKRALGLHGGLDDKGAALVLPEPIGFSRPTEQPINTSLSGG